MRELIRNGFGGLNKSPVNETYGASNGFTLPIRLFGSSAKAAG
jgi:hypothetical protein